MIKVDFQVADVTDQLLRRMALLGWVSPSTLIEPAEDTAQLLAPLTRLLPDCEVGSGPHAGQWRLGDKRRRAVFAAWGFDELASEIDRSNDDPVMLSVARAIGVLQLDLSRATIEELRSVRAAKNWLPEELISPVLATQALDSAIEKASQRDDLEQLTRHRIVGRSSELSRMREFISSDREERQATLSLTGSGGTGKSTLFASFLDEIGRSSAGAILILRFDFDRADLDPYMRTTLDRELINQIGRALPELKDLCNETAHSMLRFTAAEFRGADFDGSGSAQFGHGTGSLADASESSKSSNMSELFGILSRVNELSRHVLLALDTFERVEAAGDRAIDTMLDWVASTAEGLDTQFSLLIAGRAELALNHRMLQHHVTIRLGDLSQASSRVLLRERGCPRILASALVARLPRRSPLILHLAADVVARGSEEEGAELLRTLERGDLPAELISGYLYDRILTHIDKPHVRRYAHASLALPELSRDLVCDVLVPLLDADNIGDVAFVDDIFDTLGRTRWLTEPSSADRIRLRPDLRSLVIALMNGDLKSRALLDQVRQRAFLHHRQRSSTWDKAMALYHEIMLKQSNGAHRRELATYSAAVADYARELMPFSDDLPAAVRFTLSRRDGNQADLETAIEVLPDHEWGRLMDGRDGKGGYGGELVSRQDPLVAHELYRRRPTRRPGVPPSYALQAACDTGRWDELEVDVGAVCDDLNYRLREAERWGPHLLHLSALLRYTLMAFPGRRFGGLIDFTQYVLSRCQPYGAAPGIADMVAIAEVFHQREYLKDTFMLKARPSDQMNRVFLLRRRFGSLPCPPMYTGTMILTARIELWNSLFDGRVSDELRSAMHEMSDLDGGKWSIYQKYYRRLQKISLDGLSEHYTPNVLTLPEFYRPLRQALHEAFTPHPELLRELSYSLRYQLPSVPLEMAEENFYRYVRADPHTWFYALVQHADRFGVLDPLLETCQKIAGSNATRLHQVASRYDEWQIALGRSAS